MSSTSKNKRSRETKRLRKIADPEDKSAINEMLPRTASATKKSKSNRRTRKSHDFMADFDFDNDYNMVSSPFKKYDTRKLSTSTTVFINSKMPVEDEFIDILENASNIQFENATKRNTKYVSIAKRIYRLINNMNQFCKTISTKYVLQAIKGANLAIILGRKGETVLPNGNIFGFALANIDNANNLLYVDVICSHQGMKYAGDALMNSIFNVCKALFLTKVKLYSIDSAVSFYEKYGFVKIGDCHDTRELCEMHKIISP